MTYTSEKISEQLFKQIEHELEPVLNVSKKQDYESHLVLFDKLNSNEFSVYHYNSHQDFVKIYTVHSKSEIVDLVGTIIGENDLDGTEYQVIFDEYDMV